MQTIHPDDALLNELFGSPIHVYTRAQAIEDGVLCDLMQDEMASVCRQHYKFPIACTSSVFEIMRKAVENKRHCNDYAGILHDMLTMSKVYRRVIDDSTLIFRVIIKGAGRASNYDFKMVCGPDDTGAACITIMQTNED